LLSGYLKSLYNDTMHRAYDTAWESIAASTGPGAAVLDCGANNGWAFTQLVERCPLSKDQYFGVEWNVRCAEEARERGFNVVQGDLNAGIPHESERFSCVFALSLVEHLLNPCRFLREAHRVLRPGGRLVVLTPNISTYFTAALILMGRMPSSGPHPDSTELLRKEELFKVSSNDLRPDPEDATPVHRHLVVFSYLVLRDYLKMLRFERVEGHGFGLYPFPRFAQPVLGRLDPYHCHQMVFIATK